jgi:CRISPR-associated protein Cas2
MRNAYLVSYDISDPKRLKKVHKTMTGYGQHLQYSVFRCELSPTDRVRLKSVLCDLINNKEDQVLFIDLGPADGRAAECIESLGKSYFPRDHVATVV